MRNFHISRVFPKIDFLQWLKQCFLLFGMAGFLFVFLHPGDAWAYSTNQAATMVLGQQNFTTSGFGAGTTLMNGPYGIAGDASHIYVADGNNRVLIFTPNPPGTGAAANLVLGQTNFANVNNNQGGAPSSITLNLPQAVFSDGVTLYVVDSGNNRVLIFKTIPTTIDQAADFVIGQPS
ncbi:MAG TPA: hypothetical protein VJ873_07915, partial [bacterium]|nr:hypothetical protein [bacterium]